MMDKWVNPRWFTINNSQIKNRNLLVLLNNDFTIPATSMSIVMSYVNQLLFFYIILGKNLYKKSIINARRLREIISQQKTNVSCHG